MTRRVGERGTQLSGGQTSAHRGGPARTGEGTPRSSLLDEAHRRARFRNPKKNRCRRRSNTCAQNRTTIVVAPPPPYHHARRCHFWWSRTARNRRGADGMTICSGVMGRLCVIFFRLQAPRSGGPFTLAADQRNRVKATVDFSSPNQRPFHERDILRHPRLPRSPRSPSPATAKTYPVRRNLVASGAIISSISARWEMTSAPPPPFSSSPKHPDMRSSRTAPPSPTRPLTQRPAP